MLVTYVPKARQERAFLSLLERHWPTLDRLGLVSSQPPMTWRATRLGERRRRIVEMFQWKDAGAADIAHQSPDVMAIWEAMVPLLDDMILEQLTPLGNRGAR